MRAREYIETVIDRFLLYAPNWHIDYEQKEKYVRRYERKYGDKDMGRCTMRMMESLEDCGVMTPWTKEQRIMWLDYASWHEAGHILGCFIIERPPLSARVNGDFSGLVQPDFGMCSVDKEIKRIIHVGGWAFERRHATLQQCKESVGYGNRKCKNSDWLSLEQPTVKEMDDMSKRWFSHREFSRIAKKIHDELFSRRRLSKKRIEELYDEFVADEKACCKARLVYGGVLDEVCSSS